MQKHTKLYFDYFDVDYDPQSGWHNCVSELSGLPSKDLHHIEARGMGGSKHADRIENLMALTREEHEKYGDKKQYKSFLQRAHDNYIARFTKGFIK
jgi:hypothetical protein